jgi:signal transduction histidine kinase
VILLTRPAALGWGDYNRYLVALLAASAAAAALAAGAAVLLARRLAAPIRRVADASRALASGRTPVPLPREGIAELVSLSEAFNEMASQLARAREAERAVLMSVSHELRTPLTAIRGYAEGIEDGTIDPEPAAQVVGREAGRLERLVQDLLALARLEQGVLEIHTEPVDLAAVARDVERRLLPQAQTGGVTLGVETSDDAAALADHDRTVQVLSNLVENAIRVSQPGGTVTIAAAAGRLSVSDTGPGIPPEDLPRAFERFHLHNHSDRASPDGSGLGLAIVRELTEAMGGTVTVRSDPGRGAQFSVKLPPLGFHHQQG